LQMQAWVDATKAGQTTGASAWDGFVTTLIAEQIVAGMGNLGPIHLTFPPRPALYA